MRVAFLSGGIGGAKLARGFDAIEDVETTVIVNVGDDDRIYGLSISPDLDTVVYTLANQQGPHGWGRANDSTTVMEELSHHGVDTSFTIGDRDLALNLYRTMSLGEGKTLTEVTADITRRFSIRSRILPATDDPVRTEVRLAADGRWVDFQTYFVRRRHADRLSEVRFVGADTARPAPGVLDDIARADMVVIGPSNPVLSIWPILAIAGIEDALRRHRRVVAVSPLIGGAAVKGPTAEVMEALGPGADLAGVVGAYRGVVDELVVDEADRDAVFPSDVEVHVTDTLVPTPDTARRLAEEVVSWT